MGFCVFAEPLNMNRDVDAELQKLRDEAAVHIKEDSPVVIQGLESLHHANSAELHADGWHPVQRAGSPPPAGADWEVLSPAQLSPAGSTPRSLSLTDLLETEDRHARVASNEAMAAAEAATASALHPEQHEGSASSSTHIDASPAIESSPADDGLVPEAASFGSPFDVGLHESAALLHAADGQSKPPALDDGVQQPVAHEQDDSSDTGAGESDGEADGEGHSDQGSSYAHISQPASLHSLDHLDQDASPSRPVSLASFQDLQSHQGEDGLAWDIPEAHVEEVQSSGEGDSNEQGRIIPIAIDNSHEDEQPEALSPMASSTSSAVMVEREPESEPEAEAEDQLPALHSGQPDDDDDAGSVTGLEDERHAEVLPGDDSSSNPTSRLSSLSESLPSFSAGKLLDVDDEVFLGGKSPPYQGYPIGLYSSFVGAASATASVASGAWKWLQEWVSCLYGRLPPHARAVLARAARAARQPDTTVVLGVSLALVGALYAGAMVRNKQLARALHTKERDMAQLVMKVFNLQDTLQSSRRIPIVRHTSTTCSFSFAGGGIAAV
ncbi:hypothetical protein WJX73_010310 [Symbiochloris irregularis]|uniref:Uncharacterized protein n=1 Tax=Symbiochloris irregularis TaxID=706552 RepID=A0AAW1PMT3_9CHLO